MGFSRQEYWGGLPFPSPGDLPNPGTEPGSPALQTDALPSEPPGKSLWTSSVLQRKGRMVKRAVRRHSGIAQPLGARLFERWFLKVSLAQRLWARMLLLRCRGKTTPQSCRNETATQKCVGGAASTPECRHRALSQRGLFSRFTTWWDFTWLEPVTHFYFQLLSFGMGPSIPCPSHLACVLEASKLSNFTGSQLERNRESGNTVPQVSPALDLHEI